MSSSSSPVFIPDPHRTFMSKVLDTIPHSDRLTAEEREAIFQLCYRDDGDLRADLAAATAAALAAKEDLESQQNQ